MKKILIRSSLGGYQVKNIEISKNFFSKNLNNYFYLIDKNIYSKNKIIKKLKEIKY